MVLFTTLVEARSNIKIVVLGSENSSAHACAANGIQQPTLIVDNVPAHAKSENLVAEYDDIGCLHLLVESHRTSMELI